jgi:hypothetical protein
MDMEIYKACPIFHSSLNNPDKNLIPCESLEGDLNRKESNSQVFNAFVKSLVWKFTGRDNKNSNSYKTRMPGIQADKLIAQEIANVT